MLVRWFDGTRPLPATASPRSRDIFFRHDFPFGDSLFELAFPRVERHAHATEPAFVEEDEAWVLTLEVPGLSLEDLELSVLGRSVTLRAERDVQVPEGYRARHRERRSWRLARTFTLPSAVDAQAAEASLDAGVLTVRVPKAAEARPHRITVKGA